MNAGDFRDAPPTRLRHRLLAAGTLLIFGQGVAVASLAAFGPIPGRSFAEGAWVFAAVWVVLFPCFAFATSHIWPYRRRPDGRATLCVGAGALAVILAFMPATTAGHTPWVTVVMDALGWTSLWITRCAYGKVSTAAARWMVPLVAWMPITFSLSLWDALAWG